MMMKASQPTLKPVKATREQILALAETGRMAEALSSFDRAIAENPRTAGYWENKGLLLSELGCEEESV